MRSLEKAVKTGLEINFLEVTSQTEFQLAKMEKVKQLIRHRIYSKRFVVKSKTSYCTTTLTTSYAGINKLNVYACYKKGPAKNSETFFVYFNYFLVPQS